MSLLLSKCHIVGNQMAWLIIRKKCKKGSKDIRQNCQSRSWYFFSYVIFNSVVSTTCSKDLFASQDFLLAKKLAFKLTGIVVKYTVTNIEASFEDLFRVMVILK